MVNCKSNIDAWDRKAKGCKELIDIALSELEEEVVIANYDGVRYRVESKWVKRKPQPAKFVEAKPGSEYKVTNVKVIENE